MPKTLLQLAHERAARVAKLSGGSILIGVSGKDSFATLAIAAEHFEKIAAFHMYHVQGLRCMLDPIEAACARFKAKLFMVPHFDLCRMMKFGVLRPHLNRCMNLPEMKRADCERLARKRSGIEWIAYGERLSDSYARRLFWRKLDGVYEPGKRAAFIADWLTANVEGYLRTMKMPAPCTFGLTDRSGSGFELSKRVLAWMQKHHPADYARVLRVFPAAGVQLL